MRDTPKALPYFWEVAQARLEDSPKTVHVNVARLTCEMMIEQEQRELTAYRECVEAIEWVLNNDKPRLSVLMVKQLEQALTHAQGTG